MDMRTVCPMCLMLFMTYHKRILTVPFVRLLHRRSCLARPRSAPTITDNRFCTIRNYTHQTSTTDFTSLNQDVSNPPFRYPPTRDSRRDLLLDSSLADWLRPTHHPRPPTKRPITLESTIRIQSPHAFSTNILANHIL